MALAPAPGARALLALTALAGASLVMSCKPGRPPAAATRKAPDHQSERTPRRRIAIAFTPGDHAAHVLPDLSAVTRDLVALGPSSGRTSPRLKAAAYQLRLARFTRVNLLMMSRKPGRLPAAATRKARPKQRSERTARRRPRHQLYRHQRPHYRLAARVTRSDQAVRGFAGFVPGDSRSSGARAVQWAHITKIESGGLALRFAPSHE